MPMSRARSPGGLSNSPRADPARVFSGISAGGDSRAGTPPMCASLCCGCSLDDRHDRGKVRCQIGRDAVVSYQILGVFVGGPDLAIGVLPNEHFHREIKSDGGYSDHQRRARFGVAEDQHLLRPHAESGAAPVATEVYAGKHDNGALLEDLLEAIDGCGNRMARGEFDDSGYVSSNAHGRYSQQ